MTEQRHTIQEWETSDQSLFENFVLTGGVKKASILMSTIKLIHGYRKH